MMTIIIILLVAVNIGLFMDCERYYEALQDIASGDIDMNKLQARAIKALHRKGADYGKY